MNDVYVRAFKKWIGADSESLTWLFPEHCSWAVSQPPSCWPGLSAYSPVMLAAPSEQCPFLKRWLQETSESSSSLLPLVTAGQLTVPQWRRPSEGAVCTRYRLTCPGVFRLQCASSHRGLVLWPGVLRLLKEQEREGRNRCGTAPACPLKNVILPPPWAKNLAFKLVPFHSSAPAPPASWSCWQLRWTGVGFVISKEDLTWGPGTRNFCVVEFHWSEKGLRKLLT